MPFLRTDHWRSVILHAPLETLRGRGSLNAGTMTLLPDDGDHRFLADPFGLWHNGRLHVFVEAFDYREARGAIDVLVYDRYASLLTRSRILQAPWHLSYPFVFQHEGAFFLLPEASGSGELTLYQALSFPFDWRPVPAFAFPAAAIDATPLFYAGRWYLFWTPPGSKAERQSVLAVSTARQLTGPWMDLGVVHRDRAGARPGGTPVITHQGVALPVQDCLGTYGRGLRWLTIEGLESGRPRVRTGPGLAIPEALRRRYPDGMHTLSAAGPFTLLDVKRVGIGPRRDLMNARRWLQAKARRMVQA